MSVTRASEDLRFALVKSYLVASGQTATKGKLVKHSTNEGEILTASAGNDGFGIALADAVAGAYVQVAHLAGPCIIKVLVGTGGATHGKAAVAVSDGLTDAATLGGGTTLVNVLGHFQESGSVGDYVGLVPSRAAAVKV